MRKIGEHAKGKHAGRSGLNDEIARVRELAEREPGVYDSEKILGTPLVFSADQKAESDYSFLSEA